MTHLIALSKRATMDVSNVLKILNIGMSLKVFSTLLCVLFFINEDCSVYCTAQRSCKFKYECPTYTGPSSCPGNIFHNAPLSSLPHEYTE